mmetsp:Transcript_22966/g.52558  ORF Transcript_22966/g.52558 Transcript_22966/m.52558 type:complete len:139 (+) Transcript_22966:1100-1516(+)
MWHWRIRAASAASMRHDEQEVSLTEVECFAQPASRLALASAPESTHQQVLAAGRTEVPNSTRIATRVETCGIGNRYRHGIAKLPPARENSRNAASGPFALDLKRPCESARQLAADRTPKELLALQYNAVGILPFFLVP